MKLKTRITMGFAVIATIGWILGAVGLWANDAMGNLAEKQSVVQSSHSEAANVLSAHYEWRHALTMAVSNQQAFTGSTDPAACALGQWLASGGANEADPTVKDLLAKVQAPHNFIHEQAKTVSELMAAGEVAAGNKLFEEEILPKTNETIAIIGQIEARYSALMEEGMAATHKTKNAASMILIIMFALDIVISTVVSTVLIKVIMKPVKTLSDAADEMAKGALDFEYDYTIDDEIGHLVLAFTNLTVCMKHQADILDKLADGDYTDTIEVRSPEDRVNRAINTLAGETSNTLTRVRESSQQVSAGSNQMAQASQDLATGTTQQAATIQEFSATVATVQAEVDASAQLAISTLADVQQVGALMEKSMGSMGEMVRSMADIDKSSNEISSVIKVIDDIAFQTNILALNAAVEAARAGQHGKGFAVVADEVRSLAAKSAEAAKETAGLIEKSLASVSEGNTIVEEVNEELKAVGKLAQQNASSLGMMSEASQRQSDAMGELTQGISQISHVVQSNSATAEQTAASAEEMSAQASLLDQAVGRFVLQGEHRTPLGIAQTGEG